MKLFFCSCGQRIFFDNTVCGRCGKQLGFDPDTQSLLPLTGDPAGELRTPDRRVFRHCRNRLDYEACNWLTAASDDEAYCRACRLNDIIPDLGRGDNVILWRRLEAAKRRLIYTLLGLGLPLGPAGVLPGMRFRFMEDRSRNPEVSEEVVTTGHAGGVITLNLAEANDLVRQQIRQYMHERYRTLLGHFRHESGHYYFPALISAPAVVKKFRELFGDERADYQAALRTYYDNGPPLNWENQWVSAYATAHPLEDWAESFAHYLHIVDALETGHAFGVVGLTTDQTAASAWILEWGNLSVILNELNRGLGLDDPYPFVLAPTAVRRLEFIHQLVGRGA
ncbi:MAG: putative zinc-binding metallopeptidase [Gammaproteobacteria bacterium]